jgi:hypothetical protein
MTTWIDHYWDTADAALFLGVLAEQPNVIGPFAGSAAVPGTDENRWYLSVRATGVLPVPEGCAVTDTAVAQSLLGVWA